MFHSKCPEMYTPYITNQLQYLYDEPIIQPVIAAAELIVLFISTSSKFI